MRKRITINKDRGHSSLPASHQSKKKKKNSFILPVAVSILALGITYNYYSSWQTSANVFTKFSSDDGNPGNDMNRFWGSYRPQVYMGMKTKSPKSLVTGMMWLRQHSEFALRHTCEQSDNLLKYGWTSHDGLNFGMQDIAERGFNITTDFVKRPGGNHGGDWTWRISSRKSGSTSVSVSFIFYVATDGQGTLETVTQKASDGSTKIKEITGETEELGKFTIKFPEELNGKATRLHYAKTQAEGLHMITDAVKRKMRAQKGKKNEMFYYLDNNSNTHDLKLPNAKTDVIFYQVTVDLPCDIEVIFESGSFKNRPNILSGDIFDTTLASWKEKFDMKFESRFPLELKGFSKAEINFAKAALSNMVGGIAHFYGHSLVQSEYQSSPVASWDSHLLTAIPSRSFFPRGFLWDEGFHELLISKWDRSLSQEIIESWFNKMNVDGWIPREQILGDESLSKVPAEFVVQHTTNANPPTLFLVIESMLKGVDAENISPTDKAFLGRIYPKLKTWFNWFNTTQHGKEPFTYRWRGRKQGSDDELNPKTLTSGLDDYPRASHPSDDERHIDLRCWIALASKAMARISSIIHPNSAEQSSYEATYLALTDPELMNKLHWNADLGIFSDYGNHSDNSYLARKTFQRQNGPPEYRMERVTRRQPELQLVNSFGYVSLFPFLLQLLDHDSPQLYRILEDLGEKDMLWTNYGLRSLSKGDHMYMKRNTEHDPPYWRGQVWININFLAVRALKHYAQGEGQNAAKAQQLYLALRSNLHKNLYKQYTKTGYLWEQYSDKDGTGKGCYPFTGWSALVVLIMSEEF